MTEQSEVIMIDQSQQSPSDLLLMDQAIEMVNTSFNLFEKW